MFHGPVSPTGRWEEKCSAEMKYQSCPHVIYSTSLQWELFLTLVSFFFSPPFFFLVSQEITTSFCECLRKGANWMVENQLRLDVVLTQPTWFHFLSIFPVTFLPLFIAQYITQNDSRQKNVHHFNRRTVTCTSVIWFHSSPETPFLTFCASFDLTTLGAT